MRSIRVSLGAALALACTDEPATDTASIGDTPPPTECDGAFDDRRATIADVGVACDADDAIRYLAEVDGWAAHVEVYLLETGVVEAGGTPREEQHVLASVAHDPCGSWDQLERELAVVGADESIEPDASTHFACAEVDGGPVTLVFTVVDLVGAVSDCAIVGHDVAGLADGLYDEWVSPHHRRDWSGCLLLTQL